MEGFEVTTHPAVALAGFILLIALLLFLIARWKWHVFIALLIPLLLFGIVPGIQQQNFIVAFEEGFGKTLGKIGVVIVLGSLIAEALKHTGSIHVITGSIIRIVGRQRLSLALTLSGFVLGIAIFSDVAFVILNPLVHASASAARSGIAGMSTGLVGALQLTHAIVPPTPGPLAAAALVGADIGKTIIYGSLICMVGSISAWLWGKWVAGPRIITPPDINYSFREVEKNTGLKNTAMAYAPIVVPIVLIGMHSYVSYSIEDDSGIRSYLSYLGWPVVALSIGVWLAYRNIQTHQQKLDSRNKWVEDALRVSAMILVVTGLGGSLSQILKGTPMVEYIVSLFTVYRIPSILLPFLIGVVGNMITGSTTVGVITAGSIVAPMMNDLGLSPEAAMLSGASGSIIIKYVNSSYFWVCTSLSGLSTRDAIFAYGGATLVGGITSFLAVCVLWYFGVV